MRLDRDGRRRWLDAFWEEAHLAVEVDGLWHMEAPRGGRTCGGATN